MVNDSTIEHKRRNGFVNSYTDTGTILAGSSVNIRIGNPSDSGSPYTIFAFSISTRVESSIEIFGDVTIDSAGTALTPENRFIGKAIDDTLIVERDVTFSGGVRVAADLWGSTGGNTTGGTEGAQAFILEQGEEAVITVNNESTADTKYAMFFSAFQS